MDNINKIKDILEHDTYIVDEKHIVNLPTKNGILDPLHVEVQRGLCITEAIDAKYNKLVTVKQSYPKDGQATTTFTADAVVLDGRDYRRIIQLLNEL